MALLAYGIVILFLALFLACVGGLTIGMQSIFRAFHWRVGAFSQLGFFSVATLIVFALEVSIPNTGYGGQAILVNTAVQAVFMWITFLSLALVANRQKKLISFSRNTYSWLCGAALFSMLATYLMIALRI